MFLYDYKMVHAKAAKLLREVRKDQTNEYKTFAVFALNFCALCVKSFTTVPRGTDGKFIKMNLIK